MELLNRIFRGDKVVWIVFMLLLLISVVEVFSAASMLTYIGERSYLWAIRSHSVFLLMGAFAVCKGYKKDIFRKVLTGFELSHYCQ